ncbi:MAG: DNA alkylation repair protein, partial [Clostridia bacterium]|nr:DNA alkylation repair protein [Clostridia bacterium]
MDKLKLIRQELNNQAVPEKAASSAKYFQVFPGGYGEGDRFIGVTVPNQHRIAREYYRSISLIELEDLMRDPVHECRLTALLILVLKFEKAKTETEKQSVVDYYLGNIDYIN